jgi:hypothetical protein
MAVSKRLRYEIFRRDNHTCQYCGATAPGVPLRVDHVTAVALGGADTPDNLVTSCEPCNSGKSSMPADAALVSDVADSALHWAAAIKQAAEELRAQAEPKRAYRAAFQQAWNEWTWEHKGKREPHELEDGWKSSIDNFREAGLPIEVWPDIIEKAMTNKTVKAENLFRYSCGIAWRMVRELQERAKVITGTGPAIPGPVDPVVQAALAVWARELGEDADDEKRQSLLVSAEAARARDVDAHHIVEAAQYAAWFDFSEINDAIAEMKHHRVMNKWSFAWLTVTGEYPDETRTTRMKRQVEALLAADVYIDRVERAAAYAGSRRSGRLYFGLSEEELGVIKESEVVIKAAEAWSQAFHSATGGWPTSDQTSAFFDSLRRIVGDGDIWIADIYPAAAAAGAYEDPDISTCLTRHLSVFEAAARPLAPLA